MCKYRSGKLLCVMKITVVGPLLGSLSAGHNPCGEWSECERTYWDPKDGELYLNRVKPEETLVEACSDSYVQNRLSNLGIGGRRLIEPSSCWFFPKFSSG